MHAFFHQKTAALALACLLRPPILSSSTVQSPAHLRSLSPPRRLNTGACWYPLLAPLNSSPASQHNTLLEVAFGMMEQQAIFGFLGELQIENYRARNEDVDTWILQLLEGPRDKANLNDFLSGDLPPSPLLDANEAHHQIENYQACDQDVDMWILQLLEGPRDKANLNDFLSGDLPPSPLPDANAHHQTGPRNSGPRGTRKRRTSPWNPTFFGRHISREYTTRKNNSRWTATEVEILVQGVEKFGVGHWTELEQEFFKTSIRTAVNLKDKWRNLVKTYEEGSKKTTHLHLKPALVEWIKKLIAKHKVIIKQ